MNAALPPVCRDMELARIGERAWEKSERRHSLDEQKQTAVRVRDYSRFGPRLPLSEPKKPSTGSKCPKCSGPKSEQSAQCAPCYQKQRHLPRSRPGQTRKSKYD